MKKYVAILACVAAALAPVGARAGMLFASDTAWQAQFSNAVKWSTLGVSDDSGTTDNTAALNALPVNQPIIADCPHGGYVSFSGNWHWQSGLTIWQQPGCWLKSTGTTPGNYPIMMPVGTTDAAPLTNVQYYGMNFSFVTPTNTVRMMQLWVDHFKFKYFMIDGSGGFAYLRGSDQEIAYGVMKNTIATYGNPGIRQFGNVPLVATSPGMHANDWFHNLDFQTGDASFQACQPGSNPATWSYNTSTDGLLYEDDYGESDGSAVILVNEPGGTYGPYYCQNITYRNVSGKGWWYASIGNSPNLTQNVVVTGGSYDGSLASSNLPALGIGNFAYGGNASPTVNTSNISITNTSITNAPFVSIGVTGAVSGFTISGSTLGNPRSGNAGTNTIYVDGGASSGTIQGNTITVRNGSGIYMGSSSNVTAIGNVVSQYAGATTPVGISLAVDPSGTNWSNVTGNTVSGITTPVVCASGQGNSVTGNIGATDCAP